MDSQVVKFPDGDYLIYKKGFSRDFIENSIKKFKLKGLRIFDHLDPIDSLAFLENYNFLSNLSIGSLIDHDYSFLFHLTNLKSLTIGGMSISENKQIDLSGLVNLQDLTIQWRKNKIKGLSSCRNLTKLCLVDYKELDLRSIQELLKLEKLILKTSSIKSLKGIENLKFLRTVELGNCKSLISIKDLNDKEFLEILEFWSCPKIEDYDELTNLPSLKSLEFVDCKDIKSIKFIKNLFSLKKFWVKGKSYILDNDLTFASKVEDFYYHSKISNK